MDTKKIMACALALALSGCATERFGREQRVTTAESGTLTCQQIDVEIAKVDGFLVDLHSQWTQNVGRRVLGILGDFGIGNVMEKNDAIASADARREELLKLRAAKGCIGTPEARPDVD